MRNNLRAEQGEVTSWLIVMAVFVAAATLAVNSLQSRISEAVDGVSHAVAGVDAGIRGPTGLQPGTTTSLQATTGVHPGFSSRTRWIGRPRPTAAPAPNSPPPVGPGDGPDNGSGGFDDTPIENLVRDTIDDFGDLIDDLSEPGPSSQDELFNSQHEALEDADYTRTGTDENGGAIFTHSGGQSTRVLTRIPDGGVHIEHTRNAAGTDDTAAITFVTIGIDGTRTERMQTFQYDPDGERVGSTETIVADGVITNRYTNETLPDGSQQQSWETEEGWTEQITRPDGRVFVRGYDLDGNLLTSAAVPQSSGGSGSGGGSGGDGDTSGQNGNGSNSLTRHDESDIPDYCGSCGDNTGGYEEVGNSGHSGAAG